MNARNPRICMLLLCHLIWTFTTSLIWLIPVWVDPFSLFEQYWGTLLTPIIIPSSPENYQNYIAAIKRWFSLREQEQKNNDINKTLHACCDIHQILLTICEEIRYPSIIHFLNVLRAAESLPN